VSVAVKRLRTIDLQGVDIDAYVVCCCLLVLTTLSRDIENYFEYVYDVDSGIVATPAPA
jgi:hypothetical protein